MKPLDDAFEIHKQSLLDAIEVCRLIPDEINKFDVIVSSLPVAMVKLRLTAVKGLIIAGEKALRVQHGNKGFIFIQAVHGMLSIRWSELDFLAGQKQSPSSGESVFIAPEEVVDKVEELLSQVDSGELVPAVDWLSRYDIIRVEGIGCLPWTSSYEKKDAVENRPDNREEGERLSPALGESPIYVVSLTGQRPKSSGNVLPHNLMLRDLSRFLILAKGNLRRILITPLFRIKSLFTHIFNLV